MAKKRRLSHVVDYTGDRKSTLCGVKVSDPLEFPIWNLQAYFVHDCPKPPGTCSKCHKAAAKARKENPNER